MVPPNVLLKHLNIKKQNYTVVNVGLQSYSDKVYCTYVIYQMWWIQKHSEKLLEHFASNALFHIKE